MICRDTPTHGWVCGWVSGWVGQWVGSGQMTKILMSFELIEIIQLSLKIYDLKGRPDPHPTHLWVVGWVSGSMGGVRSND